MKRLAKFLRISCAFLSLATQSACFKHECFCGLQFSILPFSGKGALDKLVVFAGQSYRLRVQSKQPVDLWVFRAPAKTGDDSGYSWRELEPLGNLPIHLPQYQAAWFPSDAVPELIAPSGGGQEEIAFVGVLPGYPKEAFSLEDAKYEACRIPHFAHLCSTKDPPPVKTPEGPIKYPRRQDIAFDQILIARRDKLPI